MPLDPAVEKLMKELSAGGELRLEELSPVEARQAFSGMSLLDGEKAEVASVADVAAAIDGRVIPLRMYRPREALHLPVVLYFHGGGWVIGDLDTHDNTCRRLALASGCAVVSVHYRRAPENPFPAAAEDCFAALRWVAAEADRLDVDGERIAVAGDSAGGNLAAVVSLMARDRGGPALAFQLLIYPVTDYLCDSDSMRENAEGFFLTRAAMQWFWRQYAGEAPTPVPYHSPLHAESLAELPPALVITAEYDPLRDEGEAYARRLLENGVATALRRYDGMIHGFVSMAGMLPQGGEAIAAAGVDLRRALGVSEDERAPA